MPARDADRRSTALVDVVDLKWQLAHDGVHIHVERLFSDPAYAARVLDAAATSTNPRLREAAARVRSSLGS
jgi:hypothetical protein